MPWIESHTDLESHPKTKYLKTLMGWDLDTTIGKLHRFWWWVLKFAEDGDLRKFNDYQLGDAVALDVETSKRFVESMVTAGFLDRTPFFRVHDWMDRTERYLYAKYHNSNPKKLKSIVGKYRRNRGDRVGSPKGAPIGNPLGGQPYLSSPNLTKPNQKKETTKSTSPSASDPPVKPGKKAKPPKPYWQEFVAYVIDGMSAKKGIKYQPTWSDFRVLRLVYGYGVEEGMALWDLWWASGKDWTVFASQRGHEMGAWQRCLPQIIDDPAFKDRARKHKERRGTDAASILNGIIKTGVP